MAIYIISGIVLGTHGVGRLISTLKDQYAKKNKVILLAKSHKVSYRE